MNAPAQQKLLDDLPLDRGIYPHQYDVAGDQILLVRLNIEAMANASFLDERILSSNTEGAWFPWARIAPVLAALPEGRPDYIFHMGHCGSTLLSRLISAVTGAVALREPLPLRALAFDAAEGPGALLDEVGFAERFSFFERCWARGSEPVIVKATSICTDLAGKTNAGGARAMFLYQTPKTHLAALLAGANTLNDLRGFAQMRHRRLRCRHAAPPLAALSVGELAAELWLCEASAAAAVHDAAGLATLNFESFLGAPAPALEKACSLFGLTPGDEKIASTLNGPIMKTYSKAPEHTYSPATRLEIIAGAEIKHDAEIRRGMAYLDAAGAENKDMARALELFSS